MPGVRGWSNIDDFECLSIITEDSFRYDRFECEVVAIGCGCADHLFMGLGTQHGRAFGLTDRDGKDVIAVMMGHDAIAQRFVGQGAQFCNTLICTAGPTNGNHIQVPNATIYKNVIRNLSANPKLRGSFVIGVGYDASIRKAQELGIALMTDHKAVLNDPKPQVLVDNLGSSTINLKVYFWVDSRQHSVAKVGSVLMRLILRKYEEFELTMSDDAREVIFPQGVPVIMSSDQAPAVQPVGNDEAHKALIAEDQREDRSRTVDDVSSDTEDIKKQAEESRDPEEGENII